MSALQLALADFKERRRNYSFFVTIAIALYLVFLFVPPTGAEIYFTLTLHKYRGIYNSPWVGTVVAMSLSAFLTLLGFYLIKNTIARDRNTGVWELLAATSLSNTSYLFSKFFSNLFYLSTITAPIMGMTVLLQWLRAEDPTLVISELLSPFLYLTLPTLVFVSGTAALFETVPGLNRGIGNVIYYFLYMALLMVPIELNTEYDMLGMALVEGDMKAAFNAVFPDLKSGFSLGHTGEPMPAGIFSWDGVHWTSARIWARGLWVAVGLLFTLIAIPLFDRFDPARKSKKARNAKAYGGGRIAQLSRVITSRVLSLLSLLLNSSRFGRVVLAELRLALLGLPSVWYLIVAGLWIASLATPTPIAGQYIMPMLWIMPILIWSQSGVRERVHRVDQVLFATPHPVLSKAFGVFIVGFLLAALTASGFGVKLALTGNATALFALLAGALFVPALAIACGALTKSSRTFEILYLLLWFIGPMNDVRALDYIGGNPLGPSVDIALIYFLLAIGLLSLALAVRSRQVR